MAEAMVMNELETPLVHRLPHWQTRPINMRPIITPFASSILLILLAAYTLPTPGLASKTLRIAIFAVIVPTVLDFGLNPNYTLGSDIRDAALTSAAWYLFARAVDVCIVSAFDEAAPRWVVPDPDLRPASSDEVLTKWITLPYPPALSLDRILYSLDILCLHRTGTSWIFPSQQRAFNWSLRDLKNPATPFGQPEAGILVGLFYSFLLGICGKAIFMVSGDIQPGSSIYDLPLMHQVLLPVCSGGLIAFGSALPEALFFPALLRFGILPRTALVPFFRNPLVSQDLADFWSRRWHKVSRRNFTRLGSLFPLGGTKVGNALWAFGVSGIMHSFLLARWQPQPSLSQPSSYIPLFLNPGSLGFFASQGLGIVVERAVLPAHLTGIHIRVVRWVWMWVVLVGTGRWFMQSVMEVGMLQRSMLATMSPKALEGMVRELVG